MESMKQAKEQNPCGDLVFVPGYTVSCSYNRTYTKGCFLGGQFVVISKAFYHLI